jgi:hypothetical protein
MLFWKLLHILVNISPLLFQGIRRAAIERQAIQRPWRPGTEAEEVWGEGGKAGEGSKGREVTGLLDGTNPDNISAQGRHPALSGAWHILYAHCNEMRKGGRTEMDARRRNVGRKSPTPSFHSRKKKFLACFFDFFDFSFFQVSFPTTKTPFPAPSRGALSNGTKIITPSPFPDLFQYFPSSKFTNGLSKSLC